MLWRKHKVSSDVTRSDPKWNSVSVILLDVYDDVWRQVEHDEYPEQRMRHVLTITSNAFVQSIQKQLSSLDFWADGKEAMKSREQLRNAVNICDRWSVALEQLTGLYWRNYPLHPWKGEPLKVTYLLQFKKRLQQILRIRSSYDQAVRLNPSMAKDALSVSRIFTPFSNLNPVQFNPYTDPQWTAAMNQYELSLADVDRQLAKQLREHLQSARSNPQQMLAEVKRYSDLIERETIRKELAPERESLLAQLENETKVLADEFNHLTNGGKKSSGKDGSRTAIAMALDTSRQIETKVGRRVRTRLDNIHLL